MIKIRLIKKSKKQINKKLSNLNILTLNLMNMCYIVIVLTF